MNSWGAWMMASEIDKPFDFLNNQPEIYMILGLRDLSHHLTTVRTAYPRFHAKGYHLIYREFEHMRDLAYYPESNDDSIAWATRLRNKRLPLSAGEQKLLKQFSEASLPSPSPGGYYADLAVVGGAPAGAVLRKLLDSKDVKVRVAAAETFRHGLFGETAVAALAKKSTDSSDKVRRTAVRALAVNANWRSRPAQDALIQLTTNTSLDPIQRLDAVDALGSAVRLQVRGFQQDPAMFKALVSVLKEERGPVRAAASIILSSAYTPVRTERGRWSRNPEGGWDQWIEQITAKAAGPLKAYEVCSAMGSETSGRLDPVQLFCRGGEELNRNPAAGFKFTLQAAEQGDVPAQMMVGMLYANGKGVKQDYAEAGKWWVKAADAGNVEAASHAAMLYRNGEGVPRERELSKKLGQYVEEHAPQLPH